MMHACSALEEGAHFFALYVQYVACAVARSLHVNDVRCRDSIFLGQFSTSTLGLFEEGSGHYGIGGSKGKSVSHPTALGC